MNEADLYRLPLPTPREGETGPPAYLPEGYKSSTRTRPDHTGRVTHTDHWSGRVDAEVRPKTIRADLKVREGD